jgi:hypothetical protein
VLADQGLRHRTVKVYLSALRFMQIQAGLKDPFAQVAWPRLDYVVKGIKKVEAEKGVASRTRLPITPSILQKLQEVWSTSSKCCAFDRKMLWAACCLGFFGFLRVGEMTAPGDATYDASVHLSISDIAVDNSKSPAVVRVTIKASKTDPFRKGVELYLGKTGTTVCPVTAMVSYLCVRGMSSGALFLFSDGRLLTRQRFVEALRTALGEANVPQDQYCGHSLRIGAATTAAAKGMDGSIIKTLGRWESVAYLQYIKIPRQQLAGYSRLLVSP